MRIGIAGVGRMGEAMGLRLMECGHTLTVWNRTPGKTAALEKAGAQVAANPGEVTAASDAVITILIDADAIDAVYHGADGLLSGDVTGKLFIEMSTVQPHTEVALAAKVRAKGAGFAECPVSGTVGPARQGRLIGLMGADDADAARAQPILEQLCRRVDHVGPVGAGSGMKLAVNLPLMVFFQAFGEALSLCRQVSIDPAKMIEIFAETSGGPNVLKTRGGVLAGVLAGGEKPTPGFNIDGGRKDLRTMLAEAKRLGAEMPLTERVVAIFDEASRNGWGEEDNTFLPAYWLNRKPG